MSLNLRIFLAYFLVLGVAFYLFLSVIMSEIKPGMRQSTENTLIDMTNLLAEVVSREFQQSEQLDNFSQDMQRFLERLYQAKISTINKRSSNIRIYITDDKGIVRYDSSKVDVGKDYSRWNDVYLTLRGKYGARSTESIPNDEFSTVMHVAAPIMRDKKIIGVLTVAKPNFSLQPFIDKARKNIKQQGLWLIVVSLIVGLLLSYKLTASIRKLVDYASKVSLGKPAIVPKTRETELAKLATAMDNMRRELEGKDYVEKYVYALTHELKSPVSAIKGASEIITPDMPEHLQSKFMGNIQHEVDRIDDMINRLLSLVTVEKQDVLSNIEAFDLVALLTQVLATKQLQLDNSVLQIQTETPEKLIIKGDRFLLLQALDNLIQNTIDFSHQGDLITITVANEAKVLFKINDQGSTIPDYALKRIFDRFYSLSRPNSNKKSSGLGLCFVKQIAELHNGSITIENNQQGGVSACLMLGGSS